MVDPMHKRTTKKKQCSYPFSTTSLNITIKKLLTAKVTKERKRLLVTDYLFPSGAISIVTNFRMILYPYLNI